MTKIINLFGGPGSGKSTTASGLFYKLKAKNINCELVTEFAKDAVYENTDALLWNQLHVFSEQFRRQYRLLNKVDYVITDSPILLSSIYYELYLGKGIKFSDEYNNLSINFFDSTFNEFDNINYFINRTEKYISIGRINTEETAKQIDNLIIRKLKSQNIVYKQSTTNSALDDILTDIETKYITVNQKIRKIMTNYFSSYYQEYIFKSRYARFLWDEKRRENWTETVDRYFSFFENKLKKDCNYSLDKKTRKELEDNILNLNVMPSMRCLMAAGPALEKENIAGYNCSFVAIDSVKSFAETLYILMCGTGVGFSVERQYINKLPELPEEFFPTDTMISVHDSKLGWAKALHELLQLLFSGSVPKWDMSKLRPSGAPLKTFGGRSSGPEPLDRLFKFIVKTVKDASGRKLTSLECHDIVCMIGEIVVVGGVRRSALISLSNLSDDRMRNAKSGQWWEATPYRSLANNSAVYTDKQPPMDVFMSEWKSLYDSKSGERGIFSRWAANKQIDRMNDFRKLLDKDLLLRDKDEFGCNPCSEILLRDKQFCNLSEVVVRSTDNLEQLKEKVRIATILGTFQSTLTDFKFLSKKWSNNTEEERLLGVSLTGIMDHSILNGNSGQEKLVEYLTEMKKIAILTNKEWANKLGIQMSRAITAVKPSGTVSQLVDSASGIHARHNPYYLRTIRADKKDPLAQLMIDSGFYHEEDKMRPDHNYVFYFPQKAPEGAVFRNDKSAINQLDLWKTYQLYWAEHKPSVTISVKENEWFAVGAWVYDNFEFMSGVSFLPAFDHIYEQAPYIDITEEEYISWLEKTPKEVDWNKLSLYENTDMSEGAQTLACVAGGCEI